MKKSLSDRVFKSSKRTAEGCLIPRRKPGGNGYCNIVVDGVKRLLHVVAYELKFGEVPPGKVVLRTCGKKNCIEHLSLGTRKDAMQAALKRGAIKNGAQSYRARLTPEMVATMRTLSSLGNSCYAIAKVVKVPRWTVYNVVSGKTWKEEK